MNSLLEKEITLSIIKPNALKKNIIGKIISTFESKEIKIVALKLVRLKRSQCEEFYAEHRERPFFDDLVQFMCSGPILAMALRGAHVVQKNREIMGATDPKKALKGTLRAQFGESIQENAVHGSDSLKSAKRELDFFFSKEDYVDF